MTMKGLRILSTPVDRAVQQMSYISTPENGRVDDSGRFRVAGVHGRVRLIAGSALPAGWFLKRVLFNGADITDSGIDVKADIDGLEVVLTDRATTVSGTVRNGQGVALNNCIITFFPVGQFSEVAKTRGLANDQAGS